MEGAGIALGVVCCGGRHGAVSADDVRDDESNKRCAEGRSRR